MKPLVALAVAASLMTVPVAARAATLYVDDDGAPCRQARFATIQPAIDAAANGDTIRVCPGTYREGIVVGPDKERLRILAVARRQAVIAAPRVLPYPWALVVLIGPDTVLRGFVIQGPLPPAPPGFANGFTADALLLKLNTAQIDHNVFSTPNGRAITGPLTQDEWFLFGPGGHPGLTIDRNTFYGNGVALEVGGEIVQRNVFRPLPGRSRTGFGVVSRAGLVVRANTFEDLAVGVDADILPDGAFDPGPPERFRIRGNVFRNNRRALIFNERRMRIEGNLLVGNAFASLFRNSLAFDEPTTLTPTLIPNNRYVDNGAP